MCPRCLAFISLVDLAAANFEWSQDENISSDQSYKLGISLTVCLAELSTDVGVTEFRSMFIMRTPIIIEHGPGKGLTGTMAGNIAGLSKLRAYGLTKIVVRIGNEFRMVKIENIRELSTQEQLLLGVK